MRNAIPILAVTAGAVLLISAVGKKRPRNAPHRPSRCGSAMKAVYQRFTPSISHVQPYDSVDLVARVQGFLQKCNFQEGQLSRKGQLLFQIEPDSYEAAVQAAEAELMQARARQKKAGEDYQRYKTLLSKEATARRNFESAESEKLQADAMVKAAEAKLKQANLNLSYTKNSGAVRWQNQLPDLQRRESGGTGKRQTGHPSPFRPRQGRLPPERTGHARNHEQPRKPEEQLPERPRRTLFPGRPEIQAHRKNRLHGQPRQ